MEGRNGNKEINEKHPQKMEEGKTRPRQPMRSGDLQAGMTLSYGNRIEQNRIEQNRIEQNRIE